MGWLAMSNSVWVGVLVQCIQLVGDEQLIARNITRDYCSSVTECRALCLSGAYVIRDSISSGTLCHKGLYIIRDSIL